NEGGSRQMILDQRDRDVATAHEPPDSQSLAQIAANPDIRDRFGPYTLEGLVHLGASDHRRARIATVADEIANAKFYRRSKPRPKVRIAQEDIGNGRVAGQCSNSFRCKSLQFLEGESAARQCLHGGPGSANSPEPIAASNEFCLMVQLERGAHDFIRPGRSKRRDPTYAC